MSGRAGRDGGDASIHLLFGERDKGLNEFLIDCEAPRLETLREIYRALRGFARDGIARVDNDTVRRDPRSCAMSSLDDRRCTA